MSTDARQVSPTSPSTLASTSPSTLSSSSTPPTLANRGRARRRPQGSLPPLRADAFDDTGPTLRRPLATNDRVDVAAAGALKGVVLLGVVGAAATSLGGTSEGWRGANLLGLAVLSVAAVAAGAWSGPPWRRRLEGLFALLGFGATFATLPLSAMTATVGSWLQGSGLTASSALMTLGPVVMSLLVGVTMVLLFRAPGWLLGRSVQQVRRAADARADAEVLHLLTDARRFRQLGKADAIASDVDEERAAMLVDVADAVSQRDRLYRLLGFVARGLPQVASVALYVLDRPGAVLHMVEQHHVLQPLDADVDEELGDNHSRLPLGARGVGPAGLLGLCVQKKMPIRVCDVDGGDAVSAHRREGAAPMAVLCVPLSTNGGRDVQGVLVVDRIIARAFTVDEERFLQAAAVEVQDGLAMGRLLDAVDDERARTARVLQATRQLAGVTRVEDVCRVACAAGGALVAGVAIGRLGPIEGNERGDNGAAGKAVDVGAAPRLQILEATGVLKALEGFEGLIDPNAFAGRALVEGGIFPHASLDKATPRPLLSSTAPLADISAGVVGDLRVLPLLAQGEAHGILCIASRPGEKLRNDIVDVIAGIADVAALAMSSARTFDAVYRRATTDGLTGLWNRRTLDEKMAEAVARCRRQGTPMCVLLTDVDHFKSVNDTWGHATGDEVLKGVASTLQQAARTTDIVGRLGGEEFVVVFEGTELEGARVVAERMRQLIKSVEFETGKGPLTVTSSFGVALLQPDEDGHAALNRADQLLYKAKQQGRDRVVAG